MAFVGPPGAQVGDWVEGLFESFAGGSLAPRTCELTRSFSAWGERVLEVRIPLRAPWAIAPCWSARTRPR